MLHYIHLMPMRFNLNEIICQFFKGASYFENIEINAELKYEVAFENNIEMELFMDHKGNIIIDKTKRSYMLSIINIIGSICLVIFVDV